MVRNALRFVRAQDVSVVSLDKSIEEVDPAAKGEKNWRELTRDDENHFRVQFDEKNCVETVDFAYFAQKIWT